MEGFEAAGHPVALSDDPGRYLCNQLFYIALEYLECQATPIPAGFIHLPLEKDYPTASVVDALTRVIRLLDYPLGGPLA